MAVFPVPGCPPIKIALPAIFCSLIIWRMIPAALLASTCILNNIVVRFPYKFINRFNFLMDQEGKHVFVNGYNFTARNENRCFSIDSPLIKSNENIDKNHFPDTYLSNHTLRNLSWVKTVIETQTSDMWMSTDSFNSCEILDLLNFRVNSWSWHLCFWFSFGVKITIDLINSKFW